MKGFLRHLFFPQETNNHRAKLLHHSSLFIFVFSLFFLSISLSIAKVHYRSVLGVSVGISAQELLLLTNEKRQENGVGPLQIDTKLTQAAKLKADDMFKKNYWAHNSPDGNTPWTFIKRSNYSYMYAGENLARGFTISSEIIDAWMASKSHRENMLSSNYNDVGFAIESGKLHGEDTILVVEMFGGKDIATEQPSIVEDRAVTQETVKAAIDAPSLENTPLVDTQHLSSVVGYSILVIFIFVLSVDMITVEKKKIIRFFGHNTDHIVFLSVILLFLVMLSRGFIL